MSSAEPKSPVATALTQTLSIFSPGAVAQGVTISAAEYLVLSYRDDFDYLWKLKEDAGDYIVPWITTKGEGQLRTLILVWDGTPPSEKDAVNVASYVTPYDWALACSWVTINTWSRKYKDNLMASVRYLPHLRILILDLNTHHSVSFGHNTFRAVGNSLPWIQTYHTSRFDNSPDLLSMLCTDATTTSLLRSAFSANSFDFTTFCKDLIVSERVLSLQAAQAEQDRLPVLRTLVHLWQGNLTGAGKRHQVGNLLAPMLLAKGLPEQLHLQAEGLVTKGFPFRNALNELIKVISLGGVTGGGDVPEEGLLTPQKENDVFGCRYNLRFLLVDDQYHLGFHHVLACLLFGDKYEPSEIIENPGAKERQGWLYSLSDYGELRCQENAECLLTALEQAPRVENWSSPRFLTIDPPFDVLLIDLRVWPTLAARTSFFRRLVSVCSKLGADLLIDETKSSFDPAFKTAYEQAEVIAHGGEASTEMEALTLLPLLLSHHDPSMPIIIFSSTHQRSVFDLLSHRANIITEFVKPIFSGYGEEITPGRSVVDLRNAIQQAIYLHDSRNIWRRLCEKNENGDETFDWSRWPIFETMDDQKISDLVVYNCSLSQPLPLKGNPKRKQKVRRSGGNSAPRLTGAELRISLAQYYLHYIQRGHYYDFASVPWEMLEGTLVPQTLLTDPLISDPNFDIPDQLSVSNYVGRVAQHMRNKKAHGHVGIPQNESEISEYRIATILAFNIFLDYIQTPITPVTNNTSDQLKLMESYMRTTYPHLTKLWRGNLEPRNLTADPVVNWLDFIVFGACFAMNNATDAKNILLAQQTIESIELLVSILVSRKFSQSGWVNTITIGDQMRAHVIGCADNGFYVEVDNSIIALLPDALRCQCIKIGDNLTVEVTQINNGILLKDKNLNNQALYIPLDTQQTPATIQSWFTETVPLPRVKQAVTSGRWYATIQFLTHEDAHRALKSIQKGVKARWRN